jgi:3-phenylpropionate/trans-cinnamate dioxygenase ferredoxin component
MWTAICEVSRLVEQMLVCVKIGEAEVLLIWNRDRAVACERACPHEQADLSRGQLRHGRLFCPRYLASFDLGSGQISAGWPSRPLQLCPVEVRDGQIWINTAAVVAARG